MMLKRRIHGAEHITRSDIDALQRDRFAHEYRRIHQAAAQDANQRYPPANADRGGRLLQGSRAAHLDYEINAAATANNYVMAYGDFAAGFVIVDRIGTTLELVPNLLGANGRPTGQRGALLWYRTGSDVVVPQALRMLDVPTTA